MKRTSFWGVSSRRKNLVGSVVERRILLASVLVGSQEIHGVTGKFGFGVQNEAGKG